MPHTAQDKFTLLAKTRLLETGLTVTGLARRMKLARNTVSMAINNRVFPSVRARIARELKMEGAAK